MSTDGQGTKWRRNIAENFNRLRRVHERYTQTTDGWATAYSKRSRSLKWKLNRWNVRTVHGLGDYSCSAALLLRTHCEGRTETYISKCAERISNRCDCALRV